MLALQRAGVLLTALASLSAGIFGTARASPFTASAAASMTSVLAGLPSALFISHGAPTLVIEKEEPAHKFLRGLGAQLRPKPRALVVVSAHDEESDFVVCGSNTAPYETIYDFGGFPREMYTLKYPAVGEPALAQNVYELLKKAGLRTRLGNRGLDHGHWVPLKLVYPDASIPVVTVSLRRDLDPRAHIELGRALAPLKELKDVLLVTSGGATHNLGKLMWGGGPHAPPVAWASEFDERIRHIITEQTGKQREDSLLALTKDPNFSLAHPRTEHIIPLYVAAGYAGEEAGRTLHQEMAYGTLSLACNAFGP
eukprot:tig00021168_g19113.t1